MFIITTIIIAFIFAFVFLFALVIGYFTAGTQQHQRRINMENARIADYVEKKTAREVENERRAQIHEAKLAAAHNAVVLQDTKIELEQVRLETAKLELAKLQKEINPPAFDATEYDSDRAPFQP